MRPLNLHRKLLLGCSLAVAVVAAVVFAVWPREPRYDGQRLSYWLGHLPPTLDNGKVFVSSMSVEDANNKAAFSANELKAEMAVKELGPSCLPTLLERLQVRDTRLTRFKRSIQIWATLHRWSKRTRVSTPETNRRQAITAFVLLGDTAKPLMPNLIALTKTDPDPGVRASALEVLRHLSPADYAQVVGQTNMLNAAAE